MKKTLLISGVLVATLYLGGCGNDIDDKSVNPDIETEGDQPAVEEPEEVKVEVMTDKQQAIAEKIVDGIYHDEKLGFKIMAKEGWEVKEIGPVVVFFAPQDESNAALRENVNFVVQNLNDATIDLEGYTALSVEQLSQLISNYQQVALDDVEFLGNKAKRLVYTGDQNTASGKTVSVKWQQTWMLEEEKAYLFTVTTLSDNFDNFLPMSEEIFNSIELDRE